MRYVLLFVLWFCSIFAEAADETKIVIEIEVNGNIIPENPKVEVSGLDTMHSGPRTQYAFAGMGDLLRLSIPTQTSLIFDGTTRLRSAQPFPFTSNMQLLLHPGDSIRIKWMNGNYVFSGPGSGTLQLQMQLLKAFQQFQVDSLTNLAFTIKSMDNYRAVNHQLGLYGETCFRLLDQASGKKISPASIAFFKSIVQGQLQYVFGYSVMSLVWKRDSLNISSADLCRQYDGVVQQYGYLFMKPVDTLLITPRPSSLSGAGFLQAAYLRSKDFELNELDGRNHNWASIYYFAKEFYSGLVQRRVLTRIITFRLLEESSTTYEEMAVIKDFISLPGYSFFRNHVITSFKRKKGYDLSDVDSSDLADGPYVFYEGSKRNVKYILPGNDQVSVKDLFITDNKGATVSVKPSNDYAAFDVRLKERLQPEKSEYPKPEKLLAMSDLEGNFDVFVELLRSNKIIDDRYNWIFGKGHLVLIGDFMDRGDEVTELFWLIYSLEEKAKAKGGYVHFILGNHEIMNLSGDLKYLHLKYKHNAHLLNKDYSSGLYGNNSELGRWLRTKNIIEKIGDIMFVHAGISAEMNRLNLSVKEINRIARPYYALRDSVKNSMTDKDLMTLYNSSISPFWYRGYYNKKEDKQAPTAQIDSTLRIFDARQIITGHTIASDSISLHYSGRVINTDTKHAEGKSEALLIEGDKFYRVNDKGQRWLLFDDADKSKTVLTKTDGKA